MGSVRMVRRLIRTGKLGFRIYYLGFKIYYVGFRIYYLGFRRNTTGTFPCKANWHVKITNSCTKHISIHTGSFQAIPSYPVLSLVTSLQDEQVHA